jgi:DNA-binding GntR family transcriptional regulator
MLHVRIDCQAHRKMVSIPMNKALAHIPTTASMTEETADRIREAIISGELLLGSKLSEQRIADMLGVSRSPVREAFAQLQAEGLVKVFPKRGSFVFTPDFQEADDLCEHRYILEAASLRRAIATNQDALVQALNKAIATMEKAIEKDDPQGFTKGDIEFHKAIITSGGNRSIGSSYRRTLSPLMALRTHLFISMNENVERSMGEHYAVVKACELGQTDQAVALVKEHIFHLTEAYQVALIKD